MSFHFKPPTPESMPIIVGLAGPSKSGKTFSGLRLATGLAQGGPIAFINAEGPRGHLYRKQFSYVSVDITAPYRPERYTEALLAALDIRPAVLFIDSMSHMHDGPGGMIEYQKEEIDRMVGKDAPQKERDRRNPSAWIVPKAAENQFIYTMLGAECHVVLAFRAKEKREWGTGGAPKELGWQPISSDRMTFETLFTLLLPPHSKGVPDLPHSDMRAPFDTLVPANKQIDEALGQRLAEWSVAQSGTEPRAPAAAGATTPRADGSETAPAAPEPDPGAPPLSPASAPQADAAPAPQVISAAQRQHLADVAKERGIETATMRAYIKAEGAGSSKELTVDQYERVVAKLGEPVPA